MREEAGRTKNPYKNRRTGPAAHPLAGGSDLEAVGGPSPERVAEEAHVDSYLQQNPLTLKSVYYDPFLILNRRTGRARGGEGAEQNPAPNPGRNPAFPILSAP